MQYKSLVRLTVITTDGRQNYTGPDAAMVYQAIQEANMHGLVMTAPTYLDDSLEEVMYNLNDIRSVVAVPHSEIKKVLDE